MNYAGIGSRNIPSNIDQLCQQIGEMLAEMDFTLRSGGAKGADTAFEIGCDRSNGKKEIYLPYKEFNGNTSELYGVRGDALKVGKKYHPKWNSLSFEQQCLIGRNGYQVLGEYLNDPVRFVICWTADQAELSTTIRTGGTGQGIRIANDYNIPVYNLCRGYSLKDIARIATTHMAMEF